MDHDDGGKMSMQAALTFVELNVQAAVNMYGKTYTQSAYSYGSSRRNYAHGIIASQRKH